jgi:hypothetical protein
MNAAAATSEIFPMPSTNDLPLVISWFPTGMPQGPAIGDPECTTWGSFAGLLSCSRREGVKDGPGFVPARFQLEPDGKHVRRLGVNLIARTLVVLDCETDKKTGEVPPAPDAAVARVRGAGWAGVVYTSHNHSARKALHELAQRYGLARSPEFKAVAGLVFRLIRDQAAGEDIEAAACAEGARRGLTHTQVCEVAHWVAAEALAGRGR